MKTIKIISIFAVLLLSTCSFLSLKDLKQSKELMNRFTKELNEITNELKHYLDSPVCGWACQEMWESANREFEERNIKLATNQAGINLKDETAVMQYKVDSLQRKRDDYFSILMMLTRN